MPTRWTTTWPGSRTDWPSAGDVTSSGELVHMAFPKSGVMMLPAMMRAATTPRNGIGALCCQACVGESATVAVRGLGDVFDYFSAYAVHSRSDAVSLRPNGSM